MYTQQSVYIYIVKQLDQLIYLNIWVVIYVAGLPDHQKNLVQKLTEYSLQK